MITRILFSFLATGAFAIIFNTPWNQLPWAAFTGMAGWFFYEIINLVYGYEAAIIISTVIVGVMSNYFSKKFKTNIHPFITAGIIPLVPGASAFFTIQKFIENNPSGAFRYAYETFVAAFGIVIGISVSSYISKLIFKNTRK